jgi:hypothetical protein
VPASWHETIFAKRKLCDQRNKAAQKKKFSDEGFGEYQRNLREINYGGHATFRAPLRSGASHQALHIAAASSKIFYFYKTETYS